MTHDDKPAVKRQPGLGKGKFTFDDKLFDELDAEIADMFEMTHDDRIGEYDTPNVYKV